MTADDLPQRREIVRNPDHMSEDEKVVERARKEITDIKNTQAIMRQYGYVPGPLLDEMIADRERIIEGMR